VVKIAQKGVISTPQVILLKQSAGVSSDVRDGLLIFIYQALYLVPFSEADSLIAFH
jgi:hypothetical protein